MPIASTPMFVLSARAVSFFNASLKTKDKFGLQSRSVPARAKSYHTNDNFVCTSREFWQFIFLVLDGIFLLPKLSVLARAFDWNTNERDVCTCREFWQLIFLVVD